MRWKVNFEWLIGKVLEGGDQDLLVAFIWENGGNHKNPQS
jgi:hypothetical protein